MRLDLSQITYSSSCTVFNCILYATNQLHYLSKDTFSLNREHCWYFLFLKLFLFYTTCSSRFPICYQMLSSFLLQPFTVPLVLMKTVVVFRQLAVKEPQQPRYADAIAFTSVAAVCCHWRDVVVANDVGIRSRLSRLLRSELSFQWRFWQSELIGASLCMRYDLNVRLIIWIFGSVGPAICEASSSCVSSP